MQYEGRNNEYFAVLNITTTNQEYLKSSRESELSLLWFAADGNEFVVDSVTYHPKKNEIICLTEFHQVEIVKLSQARLLKFNRPFYCVLDHDSEVGCKGILYYGADQLPIVKPDTPDLEILETVWKMLCIEMVSKDNLQLEMLQMMLKRMLILCTRIFKSQLNFNQLDRGNTDLIRDFNFLVEKNFLEKYKVSDYAPLMNKTAKSLSNAFKKLGGKTPLEIIQNRRILEARRLLRHSDKSISEVGYELGFNDVQTFSRFFKNKMNISPKDFKEDISV